MLRRTSAFNSQRATAAETSIGGGGNGSAAGLGSGIACQTRFTARTLPGGLPASIVVDWQLGVWFDVHTAGSGGGSVGGDGGKDGGRVNVPFDQIVRLERGRGSALTFVVRRARPTTFSSYGGGGGGGGGAGAGAAEESYGFEVADASGLTSAVAAANATHLSSLRWMESIRC